MASIGNTVLGSLVTAGLLAACGGSSSDRCASTTAAAACSGTFACGNSGISLTCDAATQVCVIAPGMVNCETVASGSDDACPTEDDAAAVAGCTTPFVATCSGDSATGITVDCTQ